MIWLEVQFHFLRWIVLPVVSFVPASDNQGAVTYISFLFFTITYSKNGN